jgi:hypothetical protein
MVNVKKIGAIATGALFIGATFGMASAVTVPTAFKSSYLASGGVAQAELVVGADAPGITADTESAKEIQDAVKLKLAATVGGDISITFGAQELNDDKPEGVDHDPGYLTTTYGDGDTVYPIGNTNLTLKFDGNADNDLKDSGDYVLYNAIAITDSIAGDVQFAYNLSAAEHKTYSDKNGDINVGEVITIKGDKYVVTDYDLGEDEMELGPAVVKTLKPVLSANIEGDRASVVSGTLKVLYGDDDLLYFYDGNSFLDSFDATGQAAYPYMAVDDDDITSDEFKAYKIYVVKDPGAGDAVIAMVEESQLTKVLNDEEGVMGYSSIKIGDATWYDDGNGSFLLSDPITLVKGETIDLPDTYYQLKYTTTKKFDILRKKVSAVASGTKLKTSRPPGSAFLKGDITVSTTGGTAQDEGPELDIVDETSADDSKNLVLIGGPVANTLTSDLVENGKSTVDWYNSDGDIEVIRSAFTAGKYGIIVAGQDRDATKDAAVAVAGEL